MQRLVPIVAIALSSLLAAKSVAQQNPATNPDEFEITPAAGPFAICAHGFTGVDARERAHDLAVAIRQTYKLPAYTFFVNKKEIEERQATIDKIRSLTTDVGARKIRTTRLEPEVAVLIGGYKDFDAASKGARDLKKQVQADIDGGKVTVGWLRFVTAIGTTKLDKDGKETKGEERLDHPLLHAFATRNPTVPAERPDPNKPDPFLKKLNADEEYSLLKCHKPWTLAIKEFQGAASIYPGSQVENSSFLDKLGMGKSSRDVLTASALQAHEVAKVLREYPKLKLEAYVLHTRHSSVVTVGGFDSPDDPKLQQMQRELAKLKFSGANFEFFKQPLPMQVPQF